MSEQSPDEQQQQREEGRPDPEELLRRYSLRDSDLEVPTAPVHLTPRAGDGTPPQSEAVSTQARPLARLPGVGSRLGENLYHAQRGTSS